MEKKKRWLFLSILVGIIGLIPLALASRFTDGFKSDIAAQSIQFVARVVPGICLLLYMKKVYKIKIGITKKTLFKGVFWHGLVVVLFSAFVIVVDYMKPEISIGKAVPVLLFYVVINLGIGLFEEALCRGLLFNSFKAFFGDNKKGVYLAAFLSAFLFGALHLGNLNGSNTINTITQVIYAVFFGMLFVAIYYRTKNFVACAILHGMVDFADAFWRCFLKDRVGEQRAIEVTDGSIPEAIFTLAITSVFLICALVQLRKVFKDKEKVLTDSKVVPA